MVEVCVCVCVYVRAEGKVLVRRYVTYTHTDLLWVCLFTYLWCPRPQQEYVLSALVHRTISAFVLVLAHVVHRVTHLVACHFAINDRVDGYKSVILKHSEVYHTRPSPVAGQRRKDDRTNR